MQLIYSNPYHSTPEDEIRKLCYAVKKESGWCDIPKKMLYQMASSLGRKTVLVPIPGHDGTAGYTLDICFVLKNNASWKNVRVINALKGNARPSLCELKHKGKSVEDIPVEFTLNTEETAAEQVKTLAQTYDIVLVDNVIDSGRTALSAEKALGVPCKLITIGTTGQAGYPMPKLYYTVVRLENQGIDQEDYEAVKALVDRDGNYEEAIRHMSNWDFGGENLNVAECDYEGFRATPTDPRERGDKKLYEADGYILCRSTSSIYDAFYLVREVPREDLLPEDANARTGKGTPVHYDYIPDCGENTGGFYVEIYINDEEHCFEGDRYDDMCVHPDDCDCSDDAAVNKYIKEEIAKIFNY